MNLNQKTTLDVNFARQEFPFYQVKNPLVSGFFDNAAGTFTCKDVIEKLNQPFLSV